LSEEEVSIEFDDIFGKVTCARLSKEGELSKYTLELSLWDGGDRGTILLPGENENKRIVLGRLYKVKVKLEEATEDELKSFVKERFGDFEEEECNREESGIRTYIT